MTSLSNEECPICWRTFSTTTIPYMIPCGHSYCVECSEGLRQCALCRKRLVQGFPRVKNYALASLIDQTGRTVPTETKNQQTQTVKRQVVRQKDQNVEVQPVHGQEIQQKRHSVQFKFTRDTLGGIKRLELLFN